MHADCENLILWYLSIRWSDLGIEHIVAIVRVSRSFLWHVMNDLMHKMQLWFLGIQNDHFSHLLRLNYRCKIECLHYYFGSNTKTAFKVWANDKHHLYFSKISNFFPKHKPHLTLLDSIPVTPSLFLLPSPSLVVILHLLFSIYYPNTPSCI